MIRNPDRSRHTYYYDEDGRLVLYDLLAREVRELVSDTQPAGTYQVSLDAAGLPSDVYFYRLQAGDYVESRRTTVVVK